MRTQTHRTEPYDPRLLADGESPRCLVVMYHYVHGDQPSPPLGSEGVECGVRGLTSQEFCAQLDRLTSMIEPIDWPTLYAWLCGRGTIPDRCFLLTFDDGLADHAKTVVPILQERRLRGVFFVPGAVLTSHRMLSAHAVHLLLSRINEETLEHEVRGLVEEHGRGCIDAVDALDTAAAEAMYNYESPARARLKYLLTVTLPIDLRTTVVESLFTRHIGASRRWARDWYLGWDDLTRMEALGHTIGAHGHNHEPYSRLTPFERRQDLRRVAALLSDGLGPDTRPISFPYGACDEDACAACREVGFAHAFTTERAWVLAGSDVFRLPRVDTIDVEALLQAEKECLRT